MLDEQKFQDYCDWTGNDVAAAAMLMIADRIASVATQLKYLGNGDAATTMGAIEALGLKIGEAGTAIAAAIEAGNDAFMPEPPPARRYAVKAARDGSF